MNNIIVKGARTHNLKNINITIPRDKLVVVTGLSGSGKSSLAFDTLYAEGQRRYVESLSSYARQFLSMMEKPDVDHIEGLSPAISIEQKTTSHNPRSTAGTVTEIYDYLRVLFARIGETKCPKHDITLKAQTISEMVDILLKCDDQCRLMILAPVILQKKGEHIQLLDKIACEGYTRVRINGSLYTTDELPSLEKNKRHTIEVVVDRFRPQIKNQQRMAESLETAIQLSGNIVKIAEIDNVMPERILSSTHACPKCDYAVSELSPRSFSFNSPIGACQTCDGLGVKAFFDPNKIVINPDLTLKQGALAYWNGNSAYYYNLLLCIAEHYNVDIEHTYYCSLPQYFKDILLYGSGKEKIKLISRFPRGSKDSQEKTFEGIIANLQRRYQDTDSALAQSDLAQYMSHLDCQSCSGHRINEIARSVTIKNMHIGLITQMPIEQSCAWFEQLMLEGQKKIIAEKLILEIKTRLTFLINVGLGYLSLCRQTDTLSGGEAQRIRLASQIGSGLVGVMYILDEPSIGLHQRDNQKLLDTLHYLRDMGNTVLVVEHDEDAIRQADHIVDIGPKAGIYGGQVVAQGKLSDIIANTKSLTADYLSGRRQIMIPKKRLSSKNHIVIKGASGNNLKNVNLKIPIGVFTCITGVSGSGKSTLINRTLYPLAARLLNKNYSQVAAPYVSHNGFNLVDKVINIDQSPIGRTPRSNPATYTGIFTSIREIFSQTQESRVRGYKPGRFSFNVKGGRCEACQGDGVIRVEMHFLADVFVACDICQGRRYNRETLEVHYKGKNIYDVLQMSIEEAFDFFYAISTIKKRIQTLLDVGLSYIKLGQNAVTLSGGEAQRIKLAKELSKTATGKTLYILDEPTTGLHFYDIEQLLYVVQKLKDQGNTIVIIEHNLDVIKTADWIIDLGPEGGEKGGAIIAQGKPEKIIQCQLSHTGQYLKSLLYEKR